MPRSTSGDREYECIAGKYFKDGSHVPLDERPNNLVDAIERPFRGREGIHEVTTVAALISVYVTDWSPEDVQDVLAEETAANVRYIDSVDNTRAGNFPQSAETIHRFRLV